MFILRYIDDLELRMAIKNLLNRIELGNRLSRAIAVGKPREFSAGDKEEQEIAETCNRLIKNAIVCWNYLLLEHSTPKYRPEIARSHGGIKTRANCSIQSVSSKGHVALRTFASRNPLCHGLRFCLPLSGIESATPLAIDFGAIFPFTDVPACNLHVYASQRPLPDVTQELVRGC